jgi:hypothetical protein
LQGAAEDSRNCRAVHPGYAENAARHGARLAGGINLIVKPYTRDQLARKLWQVLNKE